jgi:hypothetical protein
VIIFFKIKFLFHCKGKDFFEWGINIKNEKHLNNKINIISHIYLVQNKKIYHKYLFIVIFYGKSKKNNDYFSIILAENQMNKRF